MIDARYASLLAFAHSRGFCATGMGGGIDNSCGSKTMSAPDKDGGGSSSYDPGHFDVGPDPNGLTENDLMYSPTVVWTQNKESLVRDAVKSWKGSPTDMTLHVMSELNGDGVPGSGSGKIMRAQATALLSEVLDNGEPAPTLYRGASIPPEQDPSPLLGWTSKKSVAVAFAKKNNGEVYTLEGASGLDTSKIKAHGMGEAEWIVAHKIKPKKEGRAFCATGQGNGVTNTCSSKDSSATDTEDDEPLPDLHLLAEGDADAPKTTMKSGDGEVTVVDRKGISTPDYLDEIECQGRNCGLDVTFEEAKALQPDSDIKDDWSPLDAYVGPGAGYFTGHTASNGHNAESSIDFHGGDYGTIDDYMASDILAEKQKDAESEWDSLSDEEKDRQAGLFDGGLFHDVDKPEDRRETAKQLWLEEKSTEFESDISQMREDARLNAVAVMSQQLIAAVAGETIECCLQLYRGLSVEPYEVERMISHGYAIHDGLNSWTTSRGTARSFGANKLLLVVRKPRVGHIFSSDAHEEKEVIRPPSRMRILGVVRTSTGTVLHVDEDEDYKEA